MISRADIHQLFQIRCPARYRSRLWSTSFSVTFYRILRIDLDLPSQHNLIAIVGLGTFLTLRKLLIKEKINGTVILLGTPAEEGGGGKIKLLEKGAYDGMDACLSESLGAY